MANVNEGERWTIVVDQYPGKPNGDRLLLGKNRVLREWYETHSEAWQILDVVPAEERDEALEAAREAEAEVARLRWALKAIKRVAYIEAPPVSDEVPAKVWRIAFDALAEFESKTGGHE